MNNQDAEKVLDEKLRKIIELSDNTMRNVMTSMLQDDGLNAAALGLDPKMNKIEAFTTLVTKGFLIAFYGSYLHGSPDDMVKVGQIFPEGAQGDLTSKEALRDFGVRIQGAMAANILATLYGEENASFFEKIFHPEITKIAKVRHQMFVDQEVVKEKVKDVMAAVGNSEVH